jgi:flagellin-specific chaperone FliS
MNGEFPFPPVDVHVYHHSDDTKRLLNKILKRIENIMGTMQDLRSAVERNTSVDDSVLAMLEGISQQLKDAQAQNDPAAIDEVIRQLDANTQKMTDAVSKNTPQEETPAEQPV